MATSQEFIGFLLENIDMACEISIRKMFGEYCVYSKGKVVALVCDNQLFVKPTEEGKNFVGKVVELPAYPGSKPYFCIQEKLEDSTWLSELFSITEKALPEAKKRKKI